MRTSSRPVRPFLSRCLPVLLLAAAMTLAVGAAAQTPAADGAAARTSPACASPAAAELLASLAAGQGDAGTAELPAPGLPFLAAGCTSSSQCPTGKLCCSLCGTECGGSRGCVTPINGHCPLYP